jgi:Ricin-type beta-trefoil lectin domain
MSITLGCCLGSDSNQKARNREQDAMKQTHAIPGVPSSRCVGWATRRIGMAAALAIGVAGLLALDASPANALLLTTGPASTGIPFGGYVCADVRANSTAPAVVQAWDCHGAPNQQYEWYGWTIYTEGAHLCLDVLGGGTKPGTPVQSYPCNGTGAQQWYYYNNGLIYNLHSNLCLDAGNLANGTQLIINTCNSSSASQQWQLK